MRVGIGYDVHPLAEGRALVLGGVTIDHPRGLAGHSDADVLAHAITDALLGAAGLGTIGQHFPPDDPRYEGISSLELLAIAATMVEDAGYVITSVDSVILAQAPHLQSHLPEMALRIADRLGLDQDLVGVKATTPEGLGALGREEGISAQAVVLIDLVS